MLRYRVNTRIVAASRARLIATSSLLYATTVPKRVASCLRKTPAAFLCSRLLLHSASAHSHASSSSSSSQQQSSSSPDEYRAVSIPLAEHGEPQDVARIHSRSSRGQMSSNQIVVEVDAAGINPIDVMLCQGYGRSVVNLAQLASHSSHADSDSSSSSSAAAPIISLGREGVGRVVRVGDNVWNIPAGGRVWFSPSVGESALGEVVHLTSKQEASPAPQNLPDIEAASYPFAICTAWTALVGCAGVTPRPTPNNCTADASSSSTSSSSSSSCGGDTFGSSNPCMQFASQLGLDRSKVQSGWQALQSMAAPLEPLLSSFPAPVPINLNEQTAPKRALVLGGSGPVGLMAIQLLQYWGYEVTVTTTTASRGSVDALVTKQRASSSPVVKAFAAIRMIDTTADPTWLATQNQNAEAKKSMALVVDGVGGNDVFEQCLPLLASTGQFVTLKGEFVKRTDERGLLQGALQGGAEYAQLKARAAEFGVNYHWAVSTPSSRALNYVRELFESNVIQTNLLPIHVWRSLDAAPAALQAAAEQMRPTFDRTSTVLKPKHVVLLERQRKREYSTMRPTRAFGRKTNSAFIPVASSRAFSTTAASLSSSPKSSAPYRIAIFASSDFSIPALYALKQHAGELLTNSTATVITPADKPTGRGRVVQASALKKAALECGFAVEQLPFDIDFKMTGYDLPEHLKSNVDVGVVVSFGYMIPARIIDAFPCGVINIHPSLLPFYRGSSPIQFAIAQGDAQTGVSIIDVHPTQIDGGNIISQSILPLPSDGTFASMSPVLAEQGAKQLIEVVQNLTQFRQNSLQQSDLNQPPAFAQSSTAVALPPPTKEQLAVRASAPRIPKSAGELLFHSHTPDMIYRIYRACYGFLPLFTHFQGMRITIHQILSPQNVSQRRAEAEKRKQSHQPSTKESPFPTMADAHSQGAGGIFYDADVQALGILCKDSSIESPQVIYVSEVQVAFKPNQVSASTFASGYLDKRRAVKPAPKKRDPRNASTETASIAVEKKPESKNLTPAPASTPEWKFTPTPAAAESKDVSKTQPSSASDWFGPRLVP